jgi:hypothetical protein
MLSSRLSRITGEPTPSTGSPSINVGETWCRIRELLGDNVDRWLGGSVTLMPEAVELVIFDCDGVLVDSEPIAVRIDLEVLAEFGLELSSPR